jgi:hypothetical protein
MPTQSEAVLLRRHENQSMIGSPIARPFATEAVAMPSLGLSDPLAILGSAPWPDAPWWRRLAPSTIFVLLSAAIAVFFLLHELVIAGKLGFPTGQSWVEQAYARNFFHHLTFELNSGNGSAGPASTFWVVVLSIAVNLFNDPIIAGKLLGTIFLFLTGYYAFRLFRTVHLDYGSSLLGGALMITFGALAWSELSGLESTLSTAVLAGALWWYFQEPHVLHRKFHALVTGGIFALATLTRPEIALVFPLVLLWHCIHKSRGPNAFRQALLMLTAFIVVLAPAEITNYAVSGSLVPTGYITGLGQESAIRLARHGEIVGLLNRLLFSFRGIWAMTRDLYLPQNPVFLITIPVALWAMRRNPLIERDRAGDLLKLSALIIVTFPYLRAFMLGNDDSFGDYAREAHFLLPVYAIAGVLSIRALVRYELFRSLSPKQMILGSAIAIVIAGCAFLLISGLDRNDISTLPPILNCALLLFFTSILLFAGLRHAEIPFLKKEIPHFVTEEERNKMTFSIAEDAEETSRLSQPALVVLHALLLIMLAWNIATLPKAANDFGGDVRRVNGERGNF